MDRNEALRLVTKYIKAQGGETCDGLTSSKVWQRAILVEDPEAHGRIVFDIERHHAILGETYRPGHPMAAYETYWERYAFDPDTQELEYVGEQGEREIHIDYYSLAVNHAGALSFDFEPASNGQHWCTEPCYGFGRQLVKSAEDVEAIAIEIVREWDLSLYADQLSEEDSARHIALLKEWVEEEARTQARLSWESYRGSGE